MSFTLNAIDEREESLVEWARVHAPMIYGNSAAMQSLIVSMSTLAEIMEYKENAK